MNQQGIEAAYQQGREDAAQAIKQLKRKANIKDIYIDGGYQAVLNEAIKAARGDGSE